MSALDDAVVALRAGQPIVLPTDTVYGVAVDPARVGATARLFALKARPLEVALPVLVADAAQAFDLAAGVTTTARRLAELFWPGPLTIVLRRGPGVDYDLGGTDATTIAVRVPDHEVPLYLARAVGPLATTSANGHGRPTPVDAAGAYAELGDGVAVVIDGGPCAGAPSTVVDATGDTVRILRQGAVGPAAIEAALA